MTQREEFEAWKKIKNALGYGLSRNNTPGSDLDGYQDTYTNGQWLAWQAAQAAQPAQHEWKEAVIEQLAAHSMDAPVSDSPTVILEKIIDMAVLQATNPGVNGGWKLVPVEPTQAMCQEGQWKAQEWPKFPLRISPIYKAMLSAAPAAPDTSQKEQSNA